MTDWLDELVVELKEEKYRQVEPRRYNNHLLDDLLEEVVIFLPRNRKKDLLVDDLIGEMDDFLIQIKDY